MKKVIFLAIIPFVLIYFSSTAQRITYSEPERDDVKTISYDIIGKINGNILVYKINRDGLYISLYDANMKLVEKNKMTYLPQKISSVDFINYPDYFLLIYQYHEKNIVYSMAAQLDGKGRLMNDPVQLDSTEIGNLKVNNIYSLVHSEDKQKLMVFKINSRNDRENIVTTVLFDPSLHIIHKSGTLIQMPERNTFLTEFHLDNDGDAAFVKATRASQNDNITKLILLTKPALHDEVRSTDLRLSNLYLDDVRLKVDNVNKHYLVTSFFSKQRKNNIDGLYLLLWDKQNNKEIYNGTANFSDELRDEARGGNSMKSAFNDYFLRNIIMKNEGGFIISAEENYSSTRGNNIMNRWDYMYGNPYMAYGYYPYGSPFYYPYSMFDYGYGSVNQTRYSADNIAVISFDDKGKMEWSNVIQKTQYDDNTDNYIGYGLINTGDQLHYLFNAQERRQTVFSDQTISPEGQISNNVTFKNLDRGYNFMPRRAKQVGARQIIVPCLYRNYICFAKVEL
ncbi:MAG: sulfur globule family protein [Bacteroidota bacterium]|nr:sulfur globule family protein [Bacteroidota bacterium]